MFSWWSVENWKILSLRRRCYQLIFPSLSYIFPSIFFSIKQVKNCPSGRSFWSWLRLFYERILSKKQFSYSCRLMNRIVKCNNFKIVICLIVTFKTGFQLEHNFLYYNITSHFKGKSERFFPDCMFCSISGKKGRIFNCYSLVGNWKL